MAHYEPSDWDRKIRHGVNPDGTAGPMPSEDFAAMSDQELSDIIAFIQSVPAVDNVVPPVTLGPLGKVLIATGELRMSADALAAATDHPKTAPPEAVTAEFGGHLARVCTGCHRAGFEGGKATVGDPSWPPAANLTTGPGGVGASYTQEAFVKTLRTGVTPSGRAVTNPMDLMVKYSSQWTDTELQAVWTWMQTLEPKPTGS